MSILNCERCGENWVDTDWDTDSFKEFGGEMLCPDCYELVTEEYAKWSAFCYPKNQPWWWLENMESQFQKLMKENDNG